MRGSTEKKSPFFVVSDYFSVYEFCYSIRNLRFFFANFVLFLPSSQASTSTAAAANEFDIVDDDTPNNDNAEDNVPNDISSTSSSSDDDNETPRRYSLANPPKPKHCEFMPNVPYYERKLR